LIVQAEEARKFINTQLAEETLIDSMLEPGSVDKDTRLMHTNFFFFKGNWDRPFFTRSRKDYEFHILDGRVVDAQFMHSYDDQFIATHDGFKVLKIPYTLHDQFTRLPITSSEKADLARAMVDLAKAMGRDPPVFPRYSMCFFLPDDHDGLWNLEKMASSQTFVHEHLPDKRIEVGKFRVPMFKLFSSTNVKQVLQDLGVKSLFTRKADVPDMLENDGCSDPFFVNEMLHKVVFAVNEDSAQPTSDSKLCLIDDEGPEPSSGGSDFIIDHPFMFFVVEEVSGAIILAGRVTDPSIMKLSLD
jgi:serpin B